MSDQEIKSKKSILRKQLLNNRQHFAKKKHETASQKIKEHICSLPDYQKAEKIALYYPFKGEVDTLPIIEQIESDGKDCYLPVIDFSQIRFVNFYRFDGDLIPNKFGIMEPNIATSSNPIDLESLDLILVPCVAFDRDDYRLGFGGGYYDNIIYRIRKFDKQPRIVGVAFKNQKVDYIPRQSWDMPLDIFITD